MPNAEPLKFDWVQKRQLANTPERARDWADSDLWAVESARSKARSGQVKNGYLYINFIMPLIVTGVKEDLGISKMVKNYTFSVSK